MTLADIFRKRIKEIMKERKLTQYKLSELTGVPQSTLSCFFNDNSRLGFKITTLYEICSGLKIEFRDFFKPEYMDLENIED